MDKYCVDCGVKLKGHGNPKRCHSCANKKNYHDGVGATLCTADALKKRSASMTKRCANPEYRANMSHLRHVDWSLGKYDDTFDEEHRNAISAGVKRAWENGLLFSIGKVSRLECDVVDAFESLGIRVLHQYRPSGCRFTYDMYLPKSNTLIEVDGDYWHHSEWAIEQGRPECDAKRDKWAIDNGFGIIRLPESVLKSIGIGNVVRQICPLFGWSVPQG